MITAVDLAAICEASLIRMVTRDQGFVVLVMTSRNLGELASDVRTIIFVRVGKRAVSKMDISCFSSLRVTVMHLVISMVEEL